MTINGWRGNLRDLAQLADAMARGLLLFFLYLLFPFWSMGAVAESLESLADTTADHIESGRKDHALRSIDRAVEMAALADDNVSAEVLQRLARQEAALGSTRRALATLTLALERVSDPRLEVALLFDRGNLQADLGLFEAAITSFDAVCDDEARDPSLCRLARINIAKASSRLDRVTTFRSVLAGLTEAGELTADVNLDLAEAGLRLLGQGHAELAPSVLTLLDAAERNLAGQQNALLMSLVTGYRGHLHEMEGRREQAMATTREAMLLAWSAREPRVLYRWQWQLGRLQLAAGNRQAALDSYRASMASMLEARSSFIQGSRVEFEESVSRLFYEALTLMVRVSADREGSAKRRLVLDMLQVMEAFTASEVLEYFDDDCVLPASTLDPAKLDPTTAVIYALPLADELALILRRRDDVELVQVKMSRETIRQLAEELRFEIESINDGWLEASRELHDLLIAPLQPRLARADVETLVVVPLGALRTVPFAALYDGERFLVERYVLATSLGLQLTAAAERADSLRRSALLGGVSEGVQGFDGLPAVVTELRSIEDTTGGDVLLDREFSLDRVSAAMAAGGYSVIHLATHGYFDPDPMHSFLLTYDDKLTLNRLQETIGLRRFSGDRLELLVLSACETAAGDERAALGLAGVSLKAGAQSTLATLWPISDDASSRLMLGFYRHLEKGEPKAGALRLAQRELLEDVTYRHPYFWSAFTMIGNWQ